MSTQVNILVGFLSFAAFVLLQTGAMIIGRACGYRHYLPKRGEPRHKVYWAGMLGIYLAVVYHLGQIPSLHDRMTISHWYLVWVGWLVMFVWDGAHCFHKITEPSPTPEEP